MNKFKWKFQKKLNRESSERLLSLLGSSAVPGSSTQEPSHELQENIIRETKPDFIIILPWNLKADILDKLSYARGWGCQFVTCIPALQID